MHTLRLNDKQIGQAADILRRGGLLGIPTETVYGLGANGLNSEAVAHIFAAKGRPQDNPLILHIPTADWLERYCEDIPQAAYALARRFWPGPLTMILKHKSIVPAAVTAGLDTVGMRCPAHPVCRAIIAAADGPTSIYVANYFQSTYQGAIMVAAYSYMALVPIIQPPIIKAITTKKERLIRMEYSPSNVSKTTRILFPIFVTIIAGTVAPKSAELIGFLMFGNLIRECGVLDSLSQTAQNALANLVTLLLGISVAFRMQANDFLTWQTLLILALGLVGFVFDTVGGVFFAKFLNLFSKKKINPMIGAAGISAFPMASRMVHKMGRDEDPYNFLLMHAAGANVSGQIASVIAGGLIITLVENLL